WAWTFGEITLENPAVELIRFVDGDSNLGRLIPPADPATGPEDDGAPLPRLSVEVLSITGGTLGIRDETVPEPFVTRLAPIDFRLDGISTLPGEAGSQRLLINGEGGTRLSAKGEVRLDPLSFHGAVEASGPYPALLYRYLGQGIDAGLDGGELTLAFDYRLDGGEQGVGA